MCSGAGAAPPARRFPAAVRARAASGRDYAKMVLQARNKHREAAPKPPQPPRASQSPLRGSPDVGAGEPGPERAPPSPRRKGAAGRKGPRAESAAPPAGGGLGGRLAAGLRGALGLRRSGRGRTWTTLLLGEQPSARAPPGRGTLRRGPPLPFLSALLSLPRRRAPPVGLRQFAALFDFSWDVLTSSFTPPPSGSAFLTPFLLALCLCLKKNGPEINSCPAWLRTGRSALTRLRRC